MPKFYNCIEYDDIEDRYIGLYGEQYNTIEDIPFKYRHLVKPPQPIKTITTKTPSYKRQFFVLDVYPNKDNENIGYTLVKPYNHDNNIRIEYKLKKNDTYKSYNQRLQKEINKVLKKLYK